MLPARKPREELPERRLLKHKQCEKVILPQEERKTIKYNLNYSCSKIGRTNLIVQKDITSYNPTSFDNTLMLSPRLNGESFQPLVTQVTWSPHRGSISVFRSQLTSSSV